MSFKESKAVSSLTQKFEEHKALESTVAATWSEDEGEEYEYEDEDEEVYVVGNISSGNEDLLFNIDPVTCPICFSVADSGSALKLPGCGHSFCIECFQQYIQAQVGEGHADRIPCPMPIKECGKLIDQKVLNEVLDKEGQAKLEKFSLSAFVMANADYHHCPTPDCPNVVYWKEGNGLPIVDCFKCKRVTCLKCGTSPYHNGQTCAEWKAAQQQRAQAQAQQRRRIMDLRIGSYAPRTVDRRRAGEETMYEFQPTNEESLGSLNIRSCRRCGNGVELAAGCFKMKCRCGYRFCFSCGSENAQCGCTPSHHGFSDNVTGFADFTGLRESESYT